MGEGGGVMGVRAEVWRRVWKSLEQSAWLAEIVFFGPIALVGLVAAYFLGDELYHGGPGPRWLAFVGAWGIGAGLQFSLQTGALFLLHAVRSQHRKFKRIEAEVLAEQAAAEHDSKGALTVSGSTGDVTMVERDRR